MRYKHIIALTTTLLIMLASPVAGWGPNTHMYITDQALERCASQTDCAASNIYALAAKHPDEYRTGYMFPDVYVIHYYTKFENYEATHAWSFCAKTLEYASTDAERAAAYGCYSHLISDSYSHNHFIPKIIGDTNIPNDIIHPIVEGLVETGYIDNIRTPHSMDRAEILLPLFNRAAGEDLTAEAMLLRTALGGQSFYDTQYTVNDETLILKGYKLAAKFIVDLGFLVPENADPYLERSIDDTVRFYRDGTTPLLDPSGEKALDVIRSRLQLQTTFMLIGAPIILYLLLRVYLTLSRKYKLTWGGKR